MVATSIVVLVVVVSVVVSVAIVALRSGGADDPRPSTSIVPADASLAPGASEVVATHSTPIPDIEHAVVADEGTPPSPLGEVTELPATDRLDFLFEVCEDGACYRDATFIGADIPEPWPADRPFHVRHGFVNDTDEPLGSGFDVAVYVSPMTETLSENGGAVVGATQRYASDYVMRGESDACGPTYRRQTEGVTCEWFVHEFPSGLPAGRWAMWTVWEAPCSAWVDLGLTTGCDGPDEVMSFFSSGVDTGFGEPLPEATGRIAHP